MTNEMILIELKDLLSKTFPDIITQVLLFGSQIEGVAQDGSDFDILIIVDKGIDWRFKRQIIDVTYELDLKYDILTDVTVLAKEEMNTIKGRQPFVREALSKGVSV